MNWNFLYDSWSLLYEQVGIMLFPLSTCSFVLVLITVERALALRHAVLFPYKEIEQLHTYLANQENRLQRFPIPQNHPIGRVISYGLSQQTSSADAFKESMADQARREIHGWQRGLVWLEIIVGIAPLFGLLGTALGMIDVFANLSLEGTARAEALSRGISEALLTTVYGLSVGIPALIAFNLLTRKIANLGIFMEEELMRFHRRLFESES